MNTQNQMTDKKQKNRNQIKNASITVLGLLFVAATVGVAYQFNKNEELRADLAMYQENADVASMDQLASYKEIENNLASISMHEGAIRESMSLEGVEDPKERIKAEITAIENLIKENNEIIADLNNKVDQKDGRLTAYKKEVGTLKTRLSEYKDNLSKLESLNAKLADNLEGEMQRSQELQATVTETKMELVEREQEVALLDADLHKAYYCVGEFKELKEKQIVSKDGGIFGIAAAKEMNPEADEAAFTEIDIRFLNRIPVYKKNAEIVTTHDPESYEVVSNGNTIEWIEILDPKKFWENSKYLVVVTKDGWI